MKLVQLLGFYVLCLTLVACKKKPEIKQRGPHEFNYDNQGADWHDACHNGRRQSPINIDSEQATKDSISPINFVSYDVPLKTPIKVTNNGHSVYMHIPDTINGEKPYINGGMLTGDFEAIEVHFHWGSVSRKGSEHAINRERFDVEMHIVHKRTDFYSVAAAKLKDGGLAVLCIFLRASSDTDSEVYGLNNIFNQLPRLLKPNSFVSIFGELYLKDILGNLDTDEFYTYNGSLTTPTCNEVVTFTIFTDVLDVKRTHIEKFWALRDSRNKLLINNYRNFMPINGRPIYFRAGQQNIQTMPKSYLAMLLILSKTIIRFYK